jgi:hypothetical protein
MKEEYGSDDIDQTREQVEIRLRTMEDYQRDFEKNKTNQTSRGPCDCRV